MRSVGRLASRISLRLMLFNLLLVFLPVGGILVLNIYEKHLEDAQLQSMFRQARMAVAMMQSDGVTHLEELGPVLRRTVPTDGRFRVVDPQGRVILDSGAPDDSIVETPVQRHWLYRLGAALVKTPLKILRGDRPALPSSEGYDRSRLLRGKEVRGALLGLETAEKRVSDAMQITLYTAVPIYDRGNTIGSVLVSRSTAEIRQDLQAIRLAVFQIFLVSIGVAVVLTLIMSTTIVRPLRQLRKEAGEILDRRGRLRGRFSASDKRDEIGDLSRALERLTRRLEQHQQLTETFATDVSHELKNPLASIRMATEMLAQVDRPEDRTRFSRIAESEIARMENLLAQVREITVLGTDIQREERTSTDLRPLLLRLVEGFQLREKEAVQFDLQLPEESLVVAASEPHLLQVFENLLDNAVSFSPSGARVEIRGSRSDHKVAIRVLDEGAGIPIEHLDRLFDRFFTYRPEPVAKVRHTGLGLSIVKTIVEAYGGTVKASNREPRGAEFEVVLPAA